MTSIVGFAYLLAIAALLMGDKKEGAIPEQTYVITPTSGGYEPPREK